MMIYTTMQQRNKALQSILYSFAYIINVYFVATTTTAPTTSWSRYPTSSWYYKCKRKCVL